MDKTQFSTTLAFIPWNYRRTQQSVADLFRKRPDRLSICVHGCDHSEAEFAGNDVGKLNAKVCLASQRMQVHDASTGLFHSKVMVFPQGRFSIQALSALKANNYFATVNAGVKPIGVTDPHHVTLAECLELAVTKYGFALFLRRYPCMLAQFACDLFFGRPALIAEHHSAFRHDGKRLLQLVREINSLPGSVEWTGLQEAVVRAYLQRDISDDLRVCKIYASYQVVDNEDGWARNYFIMKAENNEIPVKSVLINGEATRFTVVNNCLRLFVRIPARSSVTVRVVYRNVLPSADGHEGLIRTSRLWTRRMLSEFRDNVLCRSDFLLTTANAAKGWLYKKRRKTRVTL